MPVFADCVRRGTRALQPLAEDVTEGTLYFVTDEGVVERSTGVSWQSFSGASGVQPHHVTHQAGGTDPIKLDDLAAPDDNTDLNSNAARHGLLPKLSGVARDTLNGLGNWQAYGVSIPAGTLAQQPGGLGPAHAGLLYQVLAPYNHTCRWNGTAWEFAPGDCGNGFFVHRALVPQEPGWVICNGAMTDYLVVGGAALTTGAFGTPNLVGSPAFLKSHFGYDATIYPGTGATTGAAGAGATGVGGPTATDAGGGGATGGYGGQSATTSAAGYHDHGSATGGDGGHHHGGGTYGSGPHSHHVQEQPMTGPNANRDADAGSSFGAAQSNHTHTVVAHFTDADGDHTHEILTDDVGPHAHYIPPDGSHTHTVPVADHVHAVPVHAHTLAQHQHTLPDHTHAVPVSEPAKILVPVYFRR